MFLSIFVLLTSCSSVARFAHAEDTGWMLPDGATEKHMDVISGTPWPHGVLVLFQNHCSLSLTALGSTQSGLIDFSARCTSAPEKRVRNLGL